MMEPTERTWGVTPVPDRLRTLSGSDVGLLWGNLGVSLLVLFTGTFLAGLGLQRALLATLVGAVLGCALLGLAGLIGFDRRVPGMVLLRDPLGERGSYAPTALNIAQNLGWAVFELYVMSLAASALSDRVFGFEARWLWVLAFAALTLWLALAGPISFVRRWVRRFAVWVVAASMAYLVWWALDGADVGGLWAAEGEGGMRFFQGVDLTVAMAASWLPLAADYTRFSRSRRAAYWGTSVGYLVPLVLLYGLGALLALSRGLDDQTAIFTAIAAGGIGSALALLALTVDEADEPFANVYSAAVSIQNLLPAVSQRLLIGLVTATATAGALFVDMLAYETFLLLLGSFFVPLFGVLAADFLLGAGRSVAVRWSGLAAWAAGFALYQWIHPTGPSWWVDVVAEIPGAGEVTLGASLPAFALAFVLYAGLRSAHAPLGRRRPRHAGSH
jgi:putative hydroxymethylpyrimidine transporter CytX